MKNALIIIISLVALVSQAQQPFYVSSAAIDTDILVYDFGEIQQSEKGEFSFCDFEVTNIGTEPLIISKCKGSCGCTTPECDKTPIPSGESTSIKVRYDTNRLGQFSKTVTIYSNASNEPEKTLRIKGTVIAN